jgi:hypothetical protein
MEASTIAEHVLISLVPWLAGVVVGGGLGYVCARATRILFSSLPGLRRPSVLLPWRTILMGLLLLVLSPASEVLFGIGAVAGAVVVGLFILLLTMSFTATVLFEYWHPPSLVLRFFAGARTLGTASLVVAVGAGVFGGGGIGPTMIRAISLLQYGQALKGWLTIVVLMLMLDLLLGGLQLIVSGILERAKPAQLATS